MDGLVEEAGHERLWRAGVLFHQEGPCFLHRVHRLLGRRLAESLRMHDFQADPTFGRTIGLTYRNTLAVYPGSALGMSVRGGSRLVLPADLLFPFLSLWTYPWISSCRGQCWSGSRSSRRHPHHLLLAAGSSAAGEVGEVGDSASLTFPSNGLTLSCFEYKGLGLIVRTY